MSHKDTAFYRGNKLISFDFSAEKINSDGSVLLFEKPERKHKLIKHLEFYLLIIQEYVLHRGGNDS